MSNHCTYLFIHQTLSKHLLYAQSWAKRWGSAVLKKKSLYSPSPHGVYSLMKVSVVEPVKEFFLLWVHFPMMLVKYSKVVLLRNKLHYADSGWLQYYWNGHLGRWLATQLSTSLHYLRGRFLDGPEFFHLIKTSVNYLHSVQLCFLNFPVQGCHPEIFLQCRFCEFHSEGWAPVFPTNSQGCSCCQQVTPQRSRRLETWGW